MKRGYLSDYFEGIAEKSLTKAEADSLCSNQHEFNGDRGLRRLLGTQNSHQRFQTVFLYMSDVEIIQSDGYMTWYNARENNPSREEWRLYFTRTDVMTNAREKDTLFICKKTDKTLMVVVAQHGNTIESQLKWLFDSLQEAPEEFAVKDTFDTCRNHLDFAVRIILEQIGIELDNITGDDYLDEMVSRFGCKFPSTRVFSEYARSTLKDVSSVTEPDDALLLWMEREEVLFRSMEKYIVKERLKDGFVKDNDVEVDEFMKFSLSVHNRRKSRAGFALENHVEKLFIDHHICYSRNSVVENHKHPDFLFPGIDVYNSVKYPSVYLTMLGVKSTCKDRWRQILSEADRIKKKHLLTLEAAISTNQTNEMRAGKIQLVLPEGVHSTYTLKQQEWLYTVEDFLQEVKEKQKYYEKAI